MADDYVCPICLNVMIEPVTLPCSHGLCKACLENTLNEAAIQCPICRYRLSVWVRRNRKKDCLVNHEKWKKIKELFSNYVNQKLAGNVSVELTDEEEKIIQPTPMKVHVPRALAAPGELKREFDLELARIHEAEAMQERASLALARQLEMEEQELRSVRQTVCERDAILATQLQECDIVTSTPEARRARLEPSSWLDRFLAEKRRLGNASVDSNGPELRPTPFRPIEAFPARHEDPAWPLRRPCGHEAAKENRGVPSPIASRVRRRAKARLHHSKVKLATSKITAFRHVTRPSLLDFTVRTPKPQKGRDHKSARQLQESFDLENQYAVTAKRERDDDKAYRFRHRPAKKA